MFGNGVTTYIMLFTTSGLPSCPCSTPVENVLVPLSCATLAAVICASEEKRDMARSPLGVVHSLPAGAAMACAVAVAGAARGGGPGARARGGGGGVHDGTRGG